MRSATPALLAMLILVAFGGTATAAPILYDQDVTPDVIFGSGNANGSFTVDRTNGVELGLRGKLRHNAAGAPENTFNSNGDGTYSFDPGVAPTQSFPTAVWSFEWSINSNWDGTSGLNLDDLTYSLSMSSSTGSSITGFDPINGVNPGAGVVFWDHSIGDNSTTSATDSVAGDSPTYLGLIAANNLAQNSWKPHWFATSFDPTENGTYDFVLTASNVSGEIARTSMTVQVGPAGPAAVVPVPAAAWMGFALLGGLAMTRRIRRKK